MLFVGLGWMAAGTSGGGGGGSGTLSDNLPFTIVDANTLQDNAMIGKSIQVFFGIRLQEDSDFTFDDGTGTITWTPAMSIGDKGVIFVFNV